MKRMLLLGLAAIGLAGCASAPLGPRVAVMPAPGKTIEQFAAEDQYCRHYAEQSTGLAPSELASRDFAASAATGAAIGALAGAAMGNHESAGQGAGAGLIAGTAVGTQQGALASRDAQRRYDLAYQQCMYAKGNQIPGYSRVPAPAPRMEAAPYPPPPPGKN
ncbi:MAG: hypothetical protein K8F27_11760 [Sulfuricellaceae bacterium]|nr:hypothetical protein [Sulfuricellaceae bacterium]